MDFLLRLEINAVCLVMMVILILGGERRRSKIAPSDFLAFRGLLVSTAAMLVLDTLAWLLDGAPGRAGRTAMLAANALYYLIHNIPLFFFVVYADFQLFRDRDRTGRLVLPLMAIASIIGIAALASPFTGFLFSADARNLYFRGWGFPLFAVVEMGLLCWSFFIVALSRKRVTWKVYLTLLAYPLAFIAASVFQLFLYGLVIIWPTASLFALAATMNIQNRRATTDHLTGAANRRSLDEELERRVRAAKGGRSLGGILVDLDDFKQINDRWGHDTGDRALEDAANILRSSVRAEDFVARFGGDEFVVLLSLDTDAALAEVVYRIDQGIGTLNSDAGRPYRLSMSIGRALFDAGSAIAENGSADASAADRFLKILDSAMYARKAERKAAGEFVPQVAI